MPITGTFYTAVEVAKIYGVDFRSVLRWIRKEQLSAIVVLGGHLIPQWALDKFTRPKVGRPRKASPLHDSV